MCAQLQASHARLQQYLQLAPLACIVWDGSGKVRAWNAAASAMFGYDAVQAVGRDVCELLATPSTLALISQIRPRVLTGTTFADGLIMECRCKDGSRLQCHWHFAVSAPGTQDEGTIAFGMDITTQLRAQRERLALQASLSQQHRSQAVGALAGGMAHDFNNLLLAIRGNVQLAAADLPAEHPARLSLAEVEKASVRAASIIDQLVSLSAELPAVQSAASPVTAGADAPALQIVDPAVEPAAANDATHHILYVDDEESLVYLVKRLLERQGYRVSGFTDARAALACLQHTPDAFDAVITDLSMPVMSGVDFTRAVLQLRPTLPVVMTSGYVRVEDRDSVLACGVRELLLKPNTVEELVEVLHRLLQQAGSVSTPRPLTRDARMG